MESISFELSNVCSVESCIFNKPPENTFVLAGLPRRLFYFLMGLIEVSFPTSVVKCCVSVFDMAVFYKYVKQFVNPL